MSTPAFVLQDIQKVPYQITGIDKDGNPTSQLPSGDSVSVASSDPTIASVVPDATPAAGSVASGFIVGQAKLGTVQITATDSSGLAPFVFQPIQVVAGAAASLGGSLGIPVAQ